MTKTTFYLFLIGRVGAGLLIFFGVFEWARDAGAPVISLWALDIVLFGLMYGLFWRPPYTYKSYLGMTDAED